MVFCRWDAEEWSKSRKKFLETLGLTTQSWSSRTEGRYDPKSQATELSGLDRGLMLSHTSRHPIPEDLAFTDASTTSKLAEPILQQAAALRNALEALAFANSTESSPNCLAQKLVFPLLRASLSSDSYAADTNPSGTCVMPVTDIAGYRTCLELIGAMVGERADSGPPCGYYAALSLPEAELPSEKKIRTIRLTNGARLFFERQFEGLIWHRVQTAVQHEQVIVPPAQGGGSRLARLKAYATLCTRNLPLAMGGFTMVENSLSSSRLPEAPTPLWLLVYLCLRCGALQEARDILRQSWDAGNLRENGDHSALIILNGLIAIDAAEGFGTQDGTPLRSRLSASLDISQLSEAIQNCCAVAREARRRDSDPSTVASPYASQRQQQNQASDPFRLLTLNLLGVCDMDYLSADIGVANSYVPGGTLEDFLWGGLWLIDRSRSFCSLIYETDYLEMRSVSYGNALIPTTSVHGSICNRYE